MNMSRSHDMNDQYGTHTKYIKIVLVPAAV
jgi:hypothetical protein